VRECASAWVREYVAEWLSDSLGGGGGARARSTDMSGLALV
jgi:hypothetical protein